MKTAWRIIVGKPDLRLELAAAEARAEKYREALAAYDWLLGWCMSNAPAGLEEMPTALYRATRELSAALDDPVPSGRDQAEARAAGEVA